MKVVKVLMAIVLTVVMLYVTRTNSLGEPEFFSHKESGLDFQITTVPKQIENTAAMLTVQVAGPMAPGTKVYFRAAVKGAANLSQLDNYSRVEMIPADSATGTYETSVTAGDRGWKMYYYFEVVSPDGRVLARFFQKDHDPFLFKSIGHVPLYILLPHIFFMFSTFFLVSMAAISAVQLVTGNQTDPHRTAVYMFWAVVVLFMGGFVFGIPMNWFAFGGSWEGVPFGTDATDNKTQLLFVYMFFAMLSMFGSFTRGRTGRDILSPRGLGWVGISTFLFMLFIYLIPHSIQFSAAFTYAFCYSVIGIIAIVYFIGLARAKNRQIPAQK